MAELETEVKLLKKELQDQAKIHYRLDVAIEKLTDVSNSIHRMLAVHEEKISRQEELLIEAEQKLEARRSEVIVKIDELHSRITTNAKEIMTAASTQHIQQNKVGSCVDPLGCDPWVWLRNTLLSSSLTSAHMSREVILRPASSPDSFNACNLFWTSSARTKLPSLPLNAGTSQRQNLTKLFDGWSELRP